MELYFKLLIKSTDSEMLVKNITLSFSLEGHLRIEMILNRNLPEALVVNQKPQELAGIRDQNFRSLGF